MDIITELFEGANVVSTRDVARAFSLSETETRVWAEELDVARIGASFAWAQPDVEALCEALDAQEEEEQESQDDDEDDEDGEDSEEESDEDE